MHQKKFGSHSEQLIMQELTQRGFVIRAHNYTTFSGEIDIIAQKGDTVAFIEVKARRNPLFDMTELISYTKQKRIIATAKLYCAEYTLINITCRFDVAFVSHVNNNTTITIIENAFTESSS